MRPLLLALLLVAPALAGCASEPSAPSAASDPGATDAPTVSAAGLPVAPALWHDGERYAVAEQFTGTFRIENHGYPVGMVRSIAGAPPENMHRYDLASKVPVGVPVVLRMTVNAEVGRGDLDIWFESENEALWTFRGDTPFGGYSMLEALIVRASPGVPIVAVVRYDEISEVPEFSYTLDVEIVQDPTLLPSGLPVGISVPADGSVTVELAEPGESPALLIWDETDAFVERVALSGTHTYRSEDGGEIVMMLAEGSGFARLAVEGATTPVRPRVLSQDIQTGDIKWSQDGKTIAWDFSTDRVPLQAGIFWQGGDVSSDTTVLLSGPTETLLDIRLVNDVPWIQGGFGWLTDMGVAGLDAGKYTASVSFAESVNQQQRVAAQDVLVYYKR